MAISGEVAAADVHARQRRRFTLRRTPSPPKRTGLSGLRRPFRWARKGCRNLVCRLLMRVGSWTEGGSERSNETAANIDRNQPPKSRTARWRDARVRREV